MHRIRLVSLLSHAARAALTLIFVIPMVSGCGDDGSASMPDASMPPDADMMPDAGTMPDADMPSDAGMTPDADTTPDAAPPANLPTIDQLTDLSTPEDTPVDVAFTLADPDTPLDQLEVSAISSNTGLVAAGGIIHGGSGASRTIQIVPQADASGTTTITIEVSDGQDTASVSFELTVTPVNDPPVATSDSLLGNAGAQGNVRLTASLDVMANDTDVDGPNLAVRPFAGTGNSAQGGDVTLDADGTFVYTPPPGFVGTDTFTYVIEDNHPDGSLTAQGTVTVEVSGPVTWFVDNQAATAGDGRNVAPFAALESVETAPVTGTGDIIMVARGDGTSSGYDQGIALADGQTLRAAVAASPPVITNTGGPAITLANGNTIANLIIDAPAGAGIAADSRSGSFDITGVTVNNATGDGISLKSSSSASFRFEDLAITASGGRGFFAQDAGTVTIAGANNTIDSAGNVAIELLTTALDVTLRRVSASDAQSGIVLGDTSGSFTLTGDGSNARNGSGGVLQRITGPGVAIGNATNVTLRSLTIQDTGAHGIAGTDITGFTLRGGNLSNNGDQANEHGVEVRNLLGTALIDNTRIAGSAVDALRVFNDGGVLSSMQIQNSSFIGNSLALGNAGINLETRTSARIEDLSITGSTISGIQAAGLRANAADSSLLSVSATGNTFSNNNIALNLTTGQAGSLTFDISGNPTITGHESHAINVFTSSASTGGTVTGTIANNTIGIQSDPNSGSNIGNGIRINVNGQAHASIAVRDNTIRGIAFGRGIEAMARLGTGGMDLALEGNDVVTDANFGLAGIYVSANNDNSLCANIRNNVAAGGPAFPGPFGGAYIVGEGDVAPGIIRLQGFAGDVQTTLQNNGNTGTPIAEFGTNIAAPAAACATP